jgi:hypothetical protein
MVCFKKNPPYRSKPVPYTPAHLPFWEKGLQKNNNPPAADFGFCDTVLLYNLVSMFFGA